MKYYLIVGEASGDLHASRLMRSLKKVDELAEFRFFGGDLMTAEGGTRVKHYGFCTGSPASAYHLCQYEKMQAGYCGMET